jgi:hypothetical protein
MSNVVVDAARKAIPTYRVQATRLGYGTPTKNETWNTQDNDIVNPGFFSSSLIYEILLHTT